MTDTVCSNCGMNPCSHQCPHSPRYYSPEQERYDEQFYGDDDHNERYAAERADMLMEAEADAAFHDAIYAEENAAAVASGHLLVPHTCEPPPVAPDPNDIPF